MVEIKIKPKNVKCCNIWDNKLESVIFVNSKEDGDKLFKLLLEQDNYWKNLRYLIKVAPKEIEDITDLDSYCDYAGDTDIWDIDSLKKEVDFIIYVKSPDY